MTTDRIEALEAENFKLAAGQCANVVGDEGGTPQCKRIKELEQEVERLQQQNVAVYRGGLDRACEDEALLKQALEALVWAGDLTQVACDYKPLHDAIAALRARLGETR